MKALTSDQFKDLAYLVAKGDVWLKVNYDIVCRRPETCSKCPEKLICHPILFKISNEDYNTFISLYQESLI